MTQRIEKLVMLLTALFYLVVAVLHLWPAARPMMVQSTALVLYLGAGLVLVFVFLEPRRDLAIWAAAFLLAVLALQAADAAWGLPFGPREFGRTLGFRLLGVPPVIGLNWLALVLGMSLAARRLSSNRWLSAFIVGVSAVLLELCLEPVAMSFDYWVWKDEYAPVQNFAAWFVIAGAGSFWLPSPMPENRLPMVYAGCQFFFFALVYLLVR